MSTETIRVYGHIGEQKFDPVSSVLSCIRFRTSEEQVMDEAMRRRKCNGYVPHLACKCGSFRYVLPNMQTRQGECEDCFIIRRYGELVRGEPDPANLGA